MNKIRVRKALLKACAIAGSQNRLAHQLGLKSQGSISRWIATGKITGKYVLKIEYITGVSRQELNQDLYP